MGRTWEARVQEYVDSDLMVQRLRVGDLVVARVHGTLGAYRVEAEPATGVGECTCPSPDLPCKHVAALLETWTRNPASFTELDAVLAKVLDGKDHDALLACIRAMALSSPGALAALGVEGFEDDEYFEEEAW